MYPKKGDILFGTQNIANRWNEYMEELYRGEEVNNVE